MMRFFGRSPVSESPVPGSPSTPLPAASSNMSPGPARPIRLVYADEKGKFHMDPEAVALLQLVKQPVGVVSVCGRARQGKSYILNQLLGRSSGFQVASTHRPCTKGLWLWSTPIRRTAIDGTEYSLLLLDSEGIDAYDQTGTYSAQIFSLAVLLSSMFIYNQMGGIDEAALDRLSLVTEMTKHIRVRASGGRSTASEIGQFSPIFVWLLRDFYLELKEDGEKITPRDYLEIALKPVGGVRKDVGAKNEIRDSIRALFPDRECFTLVRPLNDEADLQRLDQIRPDKLRPEFKSGLDSLTSFVFERSRPKQIGGTAMTGPIFARITQSYLDALNNGAVPTITSSWQSVEEAECQRAYELSTEVYMSSFDRSKPPEEAALREAHEDAVQKSMATFNDNAVGAGQVRQKYEKRLQTFFKKAFEDIKKDAFLNAYLHCTRTVETMERELRAACHAPGAKVDTVLKVLDGLLSKYEASCHGPEKWQKVVVFIRQSLEGPLLDFIKKQNDLIESEKSSLALKCRSIEDKIELLNKQLEASENYKSEYLKRYQDAMKDKENFTDDYMSRINNLQKKNSSLEEKSSTLLKTLDTARQECVDWERKYDLVLSKQKSEEEQFGAEVAMLRSKSSAAEARLGAAQEKAQSAQEEAEEWKRKYDIAVRETKNALEKAAAIQERTTYHTQSREAALREEFSCALAEKEEELKGKATRIEEAEQRLMTLSMELKAADSKVKSYDQETSRLKLEIKDLGEKIESANATALSAQSKARSLEQEKIHLEQKYRSQFERFEEILGRCKAAETEAKRKMDMADEARAEAASAQKDKSEFQRVAMERLAQIERAERHAETLERQNVDLVNEVERCRAGEMDALFKVKMLEERIVEKEKDVDMMLQSNNSQKKITAQTLEALLDSERAAHAEANNRAVALSIQLQVTQGKLDEVSQELTALRFCEKSTLDGKLRSASHGRTDDYEIGVDSVHERGTDDKVTRGNKRSRSSISPLKDKVTRGNKRSRSSSSPLKLGSPDDGGSGSGSVFRGDEQTNSEQTNQEDYTKFTKDKLKRVLTSSGFGDEVLNLGKDPKRPELLALCKKYVVAKANS